MFYSKTVYHCKLNKAYEVASTRVKSTIKQKISL